MCQREDDVCGETRCIKGEILTPSAGASHQLQIFTRVFSHPGMPSDPSKARLLPRRKKVVATCCCWFLALSACWLAWACSDSSATC